jgi:hypothetical protein
MKTTSLKNIFFSLFIALTYTSCNLLEEKPSDFITPDKFYKTGEDAIAAVNAVYDRLGSGGPYAQPLLMLTELTADHVRQVDEPQLNRRQLDDYTFSAQNTEIDAVWKESYTGINRANEVIANVPGITMDATLQARVLGEAKFLRALFYFNLVRLFGDVPLLTVPTSSLQGNNVTRTAASEVYAQIVKDLTEAEASLPVTYGAADRGRVTKGAAQTLLVKVYVTRAYLPFKDGNDLTNAINKAKEVIAAGTYSLWPDYANAFSLANENGRESIFEVQFQANLSGEGSSLTSTLLPRATIIGSGFSNFVPTADFAQSFEPGDRRREWGLYTTYNKGGQVVNLPFPYFFKFLDEGVINANANTSDANTNVPVLRYSDLLLMLAEALNELNNGPTTEAYEFINQVRRRARVTPEALPDLAGLDYTSFRDKILEERGRELYLEGHRWFDLKRTGKLLEVLRAKVNPNIQENQTVFPLPLREISINTQLVQNEGYE